MEEGKNTNVQNPTPISSVKGSFEDDTIANFQHSNYFKMMALLKDMGPHFLEALKTPEFTNCKEAQEIKEKLEEFRTLYKEMTADTMTHMTNENGSFENDTIVNIQDSYYFKMMALLNDTRPHFLEALETPEFTNCKAAQEIKEKLEEFKTLYKEMTAETMTPMTNENVSGQFQDCHKSREQPSPTKSSEKNTPVSLLDKGSEGFMPMWKEILADMPKWCQNVDMTKCQNVSGQFQEDWRSREQTSRKKSSEKKTPVSLSEDKGKCTVGSSPFDLMNSTFVSSEEASYYGRTKEEFRASKVVKLSEESLFEDKGEKKSYIEGGSPKSLNFEVHHFC